jgi:phospholipid/cholesterol/gamma-HCH transport system substrate-binding protein
MNARQAAARARTRNAILGFLALLIMVGSVLLTWFFLKGGFQSGVPVNAVFSSPGVGQQLPINGDVKVRGVLVGSIEDIVLEDDDMAVVKMRLEPDADISALSRAEIRSKTIFGQKWVELIPPENPLDPEVLASGSVIPDERTVEPLELERALQLGHDLLDKVPLQDLSTALKALAEGFVGQEDDAIAGIESGLIALRAVNDKADKFDLSLRQLREFSEFLEENDETLLDFMTALDTANSTLVGAAPEFKQSLKTFPAFLNDLASYQKRINPDLGELVEDGATIAEIIAARSDDLTDMVVQLEAFLTVWNSGLKQPCAGAFESNMTCWQVYQMPGLDSRGVYASGQSPLRNDPADPLLATPPSGGTTGRRSADAGTDVRDILSLPLTDPLTGEIP